MKKMDFSGIDAQAEDSRNTQKANTSAGSSASKVLDLSVLGKDKEVVKFSKDKTYVIKFVPYEVSEKHPKVMQGKMRAGQAAYVLDYNQHCIGPNKTMVLCPRGTYGKPCPICDRFFELRKDNPDSNEVKELKSSRRVMYNIVVLDSNDANVVADPDKVKLLQMSQYSFESPLLDELAKGDDEGIAYHMSDLCVGFDGENKALKITTKEKKTASFTCLEYTLKIISANKWKLDEDELLDQAAPLHEALITLSTKELNGILDGDEEDIDATEDDDDEDTEEVYDNDIPEAKKDSAYSVVDEEDEDTEDDEDSKTCPSGFTWAKDCLMHDECDDCPNFKACRAAHKAMRAKVSD